MTLMVLMNLGFAGGGAAAPADDLATKYVMVGDGVIAVSGG